MLIELACYNQDSTFNDILETTFIASEKGLDSVAIPSGFMSKVNGFLNDQRFAAAIDFPYGLSSTQIRLHEIILAIRQGASFIDLVIKDMAVICTSSVISILSTTAQHPAKVQFFPIEELPATALFAAIAVPDPILTLWAK